MSPASEFNFSAVDLTVADLDRTMAPDLSSEFGKLLHSASRGASSPQGEAGRMERSQHFQAFLRWLCLDLEQQVAELERFLDLQDGRMRTLLLDWIETGGHEALIPDRATSPERQLFLSDFEIVRTLMQQDASGA